MFRRVSQIGYEIGLANILAGNSGSTVKFKAALAEYFHLKSVELSGSATAALFFICNALKKETDKSRVIIPAYTATSVVPPILQAGLKPVLCDISLLDFNLDLELLGDVVDDKTLAIVPTHLFGIPQYNIEKIKPAFENIFIIEDAAQAMGSKYDNISVGHFSDAVVFSFNRGKNLPTNGGGVIFTKAEKIAASLSVEIGKIEKPTVINKLLQPFKMTAVAAAMQPSIFAVLYPFISRFKDNTVRESFEITAFSDYQAGIGLSLLDKLAASSEKRYMNGSRYIQELEGVKSIILPQISDNAYPAFNRFPLLFKEPEDRLKIETELAKIGIDTSRMYLKPLHHIFDLGYKKEEFPNACFLAERLLTLPTHPLLQEADLVRIIETFKEVLV
ncbi:DegT/DnrJ/EryC1/StrS family aminotransferase [Candidatus Margulisiibacteriota bacterium]